MNRIDFGVLEPVFHFGPFEMASDEIMMMPEASHYLQDICRVVLHSSIKLTIMKQLAVKKNGILSDDECAIRWGWDS